MTTLAAILAVWVVLSIPAGLFIGACMKVGSGDE
jgi:hypothetical protein